MNRRKKKKDEDVVSPLDFFGEEEEEERKEEKKISKDVPKQARPKARVPRGQHQKEKAKKKQQAFFITGTDTGVGKTVATFVMGNINEATGV